MSKRARLTSAQRLCFTTWTFRFSSFLHQIKTKNWVNRLITQPLFEVMNHYLTLKSEVCSSNSKVSMFYAVRWEAIWLPAIQPTDEFDERWHARWSHQNHSHHLYHPADRLVCHCQAADRLEVFPFCSWYCFLLCPFFILSHFHPFSFLHSIILSVIRVIYFLVTIVTTGNVMIICLQ